MKDKRVWYNSLPLKYKTSEITCPKCGEKAIETTSGRSVVLYACINNDCKMGFFNDSNKQ